MSHGCLVLAFAAVAIAPRRISTLPESWRTLVLRFAVLFMLSRQAMPNYWYLVAVLSLLGAQIAPRRTPRP